MTNIKELNDEELEKVAGGYTKNIDGTYNLKRGETLYSSAGGISYTYVILNDYQNITLNDNVYAEYYRENPNGNLEYNTGYYTLEIIFCYTSKEGFNFKDIGKF